MNKKMSNDKIKRNSKQHDVEISQNKFTVMDMKPKSHGSTAHSGKCTTRGTDRRGWKFLPKTIIKLSTQNKPNKGYTLEILAKTKDFIR